MGNALDHLETELKQGLLEHGFDSEKLGNHSIRKGAATFCSSGSTATPSQASIDIRGGWSQGTVKNVYQHFQEAGDQYVGRTVCGLPRNTAEFAILPPRFKRDVSNSFIMDSIAVCFPYKPVNLIPILKYALASIVYHSDYLIETLPQIFCGLQMECDEIYSSGIPPDVTILKSIQKVPAEVDRLLEERTILGNLVAPDYIRNILEEQ